MELEVASKRVEVIEDEDDEGACGVDDFFADDGQTTAVVGQTALQGFYDTAGSAGKLTRSQRKNKGRRLAKGNGACGVDEFSEVDGQTAAVENFDVALRDLQHHVYELEHVAATKARHAETMPRKGGVGTTEEDEYEL